MREIVDSKIVGSLYIFKGMLFPSKNIPTGRTKVYSNSENINDNNNTNNNYDIEEQNKINKNDKISYKRMRKEKLRRKKYFIYVDPLDDFGAASVARRKCAEAGEISVRVCVFVCKSVREGGSVCVCICVNMCECVGGRESVCGCVRLHECSSVFVCIRTSDLFVRTQDVNLFKHLIISIQIMFFLTFIPTIS